MSDVTDGTGNDYQGDEPFSFVERRLAQRFAVSVDDLQTMMDFVAAELNEKRSICGFDVIKAITISFSLRRL